MKEETMMAAQAANMMSQAQEKAAAAQHAEYYLEKQEKNLAEAQLECEKTLNKVYHKLKQDQLQPDDKGRMQWVRIEDKQRTFTDALVNKAMSVMETYVNKETLLSNFSDEVIKQRMLEFCYALNGNLYQKYETYFRIPSQEECYNLFQQEVTSKVAQIKTSKTILGQPINEEEIKAEVMQQYGSSIVDELTRIKREREAENLREYELLFVQLKAIVEATHHRAWRGEERGSLRRRQSTSEIISPPTPKNQEKSGWFGGNK